MWKYMANIFWHSILAVYLTFYSGSLSGIRSDILFGILSRIYSDIFSGILSGNLSSIYFGILSDILFWHSIWHLFWHFLWHGHCRTSTASGQWPLWFGARGWGPAVPTEIWRLGSGTAHRDLPLAVEVRRCPLRSGARGWSPQCPLRYGGWGPALPTEICRSRLRSGGARWDLELAVEVRSAHWEVRQCPLRSCAHGWGPAMPTEIWRSRLAGRRKEGRKEEEDGRRQAIKSRDPHLAGGELHNKLDGLTQSLQSVTNRLYCNLALLRDITCSTLSKQFQCGRGCRREVARTFLGKS